MDINVEYKGQKKSKLTISSLGQIRIKIADKDRESEGDIIEFAKSEKERLGDVEFTVRKTIFVEDGEVSAYGRIDRKKSKIN